MSVLQCIKRGGKAVSLIDDPVATVAALQGDCRLDIWCNLICQLNARFVLELGVWQGAFAETLLRRCSSISRYYMLDSWRHLGDEWNKPFNIDQAAFDECFSQAMSRTAFASDRRVVLRGKTTEVIDRIPDRSLDVAYVDGDHTLRGITLDLISTYPKVRPGGVLGGDDYTHSIWQHTDTFEPSLVCPFAAYFAESQGAPIIVLPFNQFAIVKPHKSENSFQFIDTTGSYGPRNLLSQVFRRV